ncbi:MAG: helix-turn-helix transcriptional regulator [Pseudomonadota bacterium]
MARDKTAWELNWAHDERMTSFMECGTLQIARGYEEFRRNIFQAMDADPEPSFPEVVRENLSIEIVGDLAWVVFDQIVSDTRDPVAPPNLSHNFRLLERRKGEWRIVIHGVWAHPFRNSVQPTIEVEENGSVQWMNSAADERLKTFEGLTVSAGQLRASRPIWDKKLRAAIERVAKLRNYAEFNKVAAHPDQLTSYPVLLGEDDSGAVLLCFVQIAKGRIYVSFGDHTALDSQIKKAGSLFGLSDAQMDIAARIANGADIAGAAEQMGISVNTARTHLRRMFDKTDAISQIDLLRLFLSLG